MEGDTRFPPNQCVDDGVDRISLLPDDIIVFILSFLSLREAASTSVLSSRWPDLWKLIPNLNFDFDILFPLDKIDDSLKLKYIELVNSVVHSHNAPSLKKFRISAYLRKSDKGTITKWLEFAFSKQIESLELGFGYVLEEQNKIVFEELLRECRMSLFFLKSLKRLCLGYLKVSGEDIKFFLRNCPLLEDLSIIYSTLTSDVEVSGTTDLMLKRFQLSDCRGKKSVKVCAPNLTWICVEDKSCRLLLFENVSKLVEVEFSIRSYKYRALHFASAVSCFASNLQILTLYLEYPKVFLDNEFPEMPNLKKLVVKYYGWHEHSSFLPVTALIWASPRLEEFKSGFLSMPTAFSKFITNVERSAHQHLKVLQLKGCCDGFTDHMVEIATYISDNCVALEKIIIGRPRMYEGKIVIGCPKRGLSFETDFTHEVQARDYLKQQLQAKVPQHIQVQVLQPIK